MIMNNYKNELCGVLNLLKTILNSKRPELMLYYATGPTISTTFTRKPIVFILPELANDITIKVLRKMTQGNTKIRIVFHDDNHCVVQEPALKIN